MAQHDLNVPEGLCVTTDAYSAFVGPTGLRERIALELSRKRFADMRWEEMWDAALRIRSMFLRTEMPGELETALRGGLAAAIGDRPSVVRSSATHEDMPSASFAGIHETYVNVRGVDSILERIRLVWASLWSDAALLYRQEVGLEVVRSAMAVLVQELVVGERSGVAFSISPTDPTQAVIEAVHGLNQGLVDGIVEPDRWVLERRTGAVLTHTAPHRAHAMRATAQGVALLPLPPEESETAPLRGDEVAGVLSLVRGAEDLFGAPQDVEWTYSHKGLHILQSRPITARAEDGDAVSKAWHLSLRRSFDNLKGLRDRIERELIPAMVREADTLAARGLSALTDSGLASEIDHRTSVHEKWRQVYWDEFIPFAHGARLFGQVYNDAVRPEDPYEFMDLLGADEMLSLERNRQLRRLADRMESDPRLAENLEAGHSVGDEELDAVLATVARHLAVPPSARDTGSEHSKAIIRFLRRIAQTGNPTDSRVRTDLEHRRRAFIDSFEGEDRQRALELLDLARASYRLRDDDNIHLGRIEAQVSQAAEEGRRRLTDRANIEPRTLEPREVAAALRDPEYVPDSRPATTQPQRDVEVQARQLVGQPAGPGMAAGRARVVQQPADLSAFEPGEVLVCDAIDPNMTFVVPLAVAIVERRGGMLIHGAIIAREYGLPCVTESPEQLTPSAPGRCLRSMAIWVSW